MSKEMLEEHFKSLNVSIVLFPESKSISLKTIDRFLDFITKEEGFWQSVNREVYSRFNQVRDNINNAINHSPSNIDQAKNYLQQAINLAKQQQWPNVYSKTSIAHFIKKQMQTNSSLGEAAIQYLIHKRTDYPNDYNKFKGYLNSYIFEESSKAFNEAAVAQENTLSELQKEYSNQLNSLNDEYYQQIDEWKSSYSSKTAEWTNEIEELKYQNIKWRDDKQVEFDSIMNELESIKIRYIEKLRLEGPATYWKDLETEYVEAGNKWRWWAIGTTLGFVSILVLLLLFQPKTQFLRDGIFDFNSLRSVLIFTIISSVCIYLITLFVKLSVSSYHLARDAKERYQITHVYLSLLNENSINEGERITILQSIFSRADTGLLKNDSGPTMPDSLTQILKLIKK